MFNIYHSSFQGDVTSVERLWSSANIQLGSILPQGVDVNTFVQDNVRFLTTFLFAGLVHI